MTDFKRNGVIINSHTHRGYIDEREFDLFLCAAEAHDTAIYVHPRLPSPGIIDPMERSGMVSAMWASLQKPAPTRCPMILSGLFDRHLKLRLVLGHAGEALPYWLYRLDKMAVKLLNAGDPRLDMVENEHLPSEYLKRNFLVSTSGMDEPDVLGFCTTKLSADNVMFAIDVPYEDTKRAADFIPAAALGVEEQRKIFTADARRIFHISETRSTTAASASHSP